MAVTSFDFEGADWDNPNPSDCRYVEAINNAIVEKFCFLTRVRYDDSALGWSGFYQLTPCAEKFICSRRKTSQGIDNVNEQIEGLSTYFCITKDSTTCYGDSGARLITDEEGCDFKSVCPISGTFENDFANWLKACKNALCKLRYLQIKMNQHGANISYRFDHQYKSSDPDTQVPTQQDYIDEWGYARNFLQSDCRSFANSIINYERYKFGEQVKPSGFVQRQYGTGFINASAGSYFGPGTYYGNITLGAEVGITAYYATPQTTYTNKAVFYNTEANLGDQITAHYIKRTFYNGTQSGSDEEGTMTANEMVRSFYCDSSGSHNYWKKVEQVSGLTYRLYPRYDNAQNYSYYEVTIPEVSFTFSGFNIDNENATIEYQLYEDSFYSYPNLNKTRQYVYLYSLLQKPNLRIENNQVIFDDEDGLTEWRNGSSLNENFTFEGYGTNISPDYFRVTFKDLIENISEYKLYLIDSGNFRPDYNHVEQGRIVRHSDDGSGKYWKASVPNIYGHYFTRYNKDGTLYNGRTITLTKGEVKQLYIGDKQWKLKYDNIKTGSCWGVKYEYQVNQIMDKNDRFSEEHFSSGGYDRYYTGSPADMQISLEELVTHSFNIGKPVYSIDFSQILYYINEGRRFGSTLHDGGRYTIPILDGDTYFSYTDYDGERQSQDIGKMNSLETTPFILESYSDLPEDPPGQNWVNENAKSNIAFIVDLGVPGGFSYRDRSGEESEEESE